nr:MAG TPA: hypothetical protein [Caudoviricetes sp.]
MSTPFLKKSEKFLKNFGGSFPRSLAILPKNEDNIVGRPCTRSCLRQECVVCFLAPGVASHHPGKALVQSWQRAFAGILCFCTKQQNQPQNDCPARQRSMGPASRWEEKHHEIDGH